MRRLIPFLVLLALAGCGGPKIHPVNGKVEYADGKPAADLAGYKVEFQSLDGQIDGRNVSAEGTIAADGTFKMTTLKRDDGALLGKHKVIIAPPTPEGDTPSKPYVIDHKYISYDQSPLTATIEAKTNAVTLTIDRRRK